MLEVLLFLCQYWTFILNLSDLNIHTTINKNYIEIMPSSIPRHKKFIIYLLEDEQELSLGMLIRLQRIYNLWSIHAMFTIVLYDFGMIWLERTRTNASAELPWCCFWGCWLTLFSAELPWCCFCAEIEVLGMRWKSMENFSGKYKKY